MGHFQVNARKVTVGPIPRAPTLRLIPDRRMSSVAAPISKAWMRMNKAAGFGFIIAELRNSGDDILADQCGDSAARSRSISVAIIVIHRKAKTFSNSRGANIGGSDLAVPSIMTRNIN